MKTIQSRRTLRLKCGLAVKGAFEAVVVPDFETETGYRLDIDWAPTTVIMKKLADGDQADALLIAVDSIDDLIARGKAVPGTRVVALHSRLGVAVKRGAPHPDISTLDAFKLAMTGARSVVYSRSGQSGAWFASVIERIGIADAVNARATIIPAGFTAEKLISGEADIAIQQLSELLTVEGAEIVGPLPDEVQKVTTFAAAVMTGSSEQATAARFVQALTRPSAVAAYRASGLDPASS